MPSWRGLMMVSDWLWMHQNIRYFQWRGEVLGWQCIAWNEL